MNLSLMSFSMMGDVLTRKLNADKLCQILKANDLNTIDMMDMEIKLYGEKKLKAAFAANGITLGCLIATLPFYSKPEKVPVEAVKALETAQRFGTRMLMVVPGGNMGAEARAASAMSKQQALDRAVEMYRKVVGLASAYGIKVGFENTPHTCKPLAAADDCRYVLEHVPGLGLIFDTGNFRVADTACDEPEVYEQLKSFIIRVHLKDVVVGHFKGSAEDCLDGQRIVPVTTGSGCIPMYDLIQRLVRDNYQGELAIEYKMAGGVSGLANADWVRPYVNFIRNAEAGTRIQPPYSRIPGLNKPVSRIFFGTAMMPVMAGKDADYLFDAMFSVGINAFDTARGYGRAENSLGKWLKHRNNREKVVILSKCGNVGVGGKVCVNRQVIEKELAASLKALGTDYIDIYLLHRDDPNTPVKEFIDTLNEAKRAGRIRIFGVSNWTVDRIKEANAYAASAGLEGFSVTSPNYGLAITKEDPWGGDCISVSGPENEEARDWYASCQMPVLAYSSLARGFFSGKFKAGDYDGAKKVLDQAGQKGYLCEENMERLKRAEELGEKYGIPVSQVAIRYIFASDMNVYSLVSTSKVNRMAENIEAANNPLSAEDAAFLEG